MKKTMIKENLQTLIKTAMMEKNQAEVRTFRLIKSKFQAFETAENAGELTQSEELGILQKMVKERKDSIEQYKEAGREDLAAVEQEEVDIISRYLPAEVTKEEIEAFVDSIITDKNKKQMGNYMRQAKEKFPTAEGKLISEIIKSKLV